MTQKNRNQTESKYYNNWASTAYSSISLSSILLGLKLLENLYMHLQQDKGYNLNNQDNMQKHIFFHFFGFI